MLSWTLSSLAEFEIAISLIILDSKASCIVLNNLFLCLIWSSLWRSQESIEIHKKIWLKHNKSEMIRLNMILSSFFRCCLRPGLLLVAWPGQRLNESTQGLSMIYSYQWNRGLSHFKWQKQHSWYLQCHHVGCWVSSWQQPCHLYRRAHWCFQENLCSFLSFQDHLRQNLSQSLNSICLKWLFFQ